MYVCIHAYISTKSLSNTFTYSSINTARGTRVGRAAGAAPIRGLVEAFDTEAVIYARGAIGRACVERAGRTLARVDAGRHHLV